MARTLKILVVLVILVLVALPFFITFLDRTDPLRSEGYSKSVSWIDNNTLERSPGTDSLEVGWSKVSITPDQVVPLAGYGAREDKMYSAIHDSLFVRTLVFKDSLSTKIIVNHEMLIVPPALIENLKLKLSREDFENIFFTATHTHSSIGAWQPGLLGNAIAGEYDSTIIDFLTEKVLESIELAQNDMQAATVGFLKSDNSDLIRNRLVREQGTTDPWLRILNISREDGSTGLFFTFAAHATCLSAEYNDLSGDYPGLLMKNLESDSTFQIAIYAAGAVGSMSPQAPGFRGYEKVEFVVDKLDTQINLLSNLIQGSPQNSLSIIHIPIDLGEPQFKISRDLIIRPWLFNSLTKPYAGSEITALQLGNNLLVGMPCDFSGELVEPLDSLAEKNGLNLMITSFNGGYVGYITKDDWYDLPKYETRSMNWYGPGNGELFLQLTKKLILKHADNTSNSATR